MLVAIGVLGAGSPGHARILEGLITGVDFIGGGAILKYGAGIGNGDGGKPVGNGCARGSVGYRLYDIAAILSAVIYVTLRYLAPLKDVARATGGKEDQRDAP